MRRRLAVTVFAAVQPKIVYNNRAQLMSIPSAPSAVSATPIERHCIIATAIAESTPYARAETIEIMRNILRRREMGTWGSTACAVVTAPSICLIVLGAPSATRRVLCASRTK